MLTQEQLMGVAPSEIERPQRILKFTLKVAGGGAALDGAPECIAETIHSAFRP